VHLPGKVPSTRLVLGFFIGIIVLLEISTATPADETRSARLSLVPMDASMRGGLAGVGKASAVRHGSKVSITGSFEDLRSPATLGEVHLARMAGIRGPVISELTVSHATSGDIMGSFELRADQLDGFRNGGCYLQIASEKAPDGNLWGWLLP
jgi:CHRD domain